MLKIANAICPKCGEPPRYAKGMFKAMVSLERVDPNKLSTFRFGDYKRVIAAYENVTTLVCGGGHEWEAIIGEEE